jgi:16S rRNA (adenine1518-N6/adenine1519-N6)-dimethyltransferase
MPASRRRRAYGQHFLHDARVIETITATTLEYLRSSGARALLEVGPGKGAITSPLLKAFAETDLERFLLVEKDRYLASHWTEETKTLAKIEVLEKDFMDVAAEDFLKISPLVVVSNLPYSAGTAILQELAAHPGKIPAMVLMFQAEVAARLRAKPGEKAWGSLSLWIQNRWDVKKLLSVPPKAFTPPPEVNSEIVVLEAREKMRIPAPPCPEPEFSEKWEAAWTTNFEKLIRIPFLHRRKMLRSGLPKGSVWKESLEQAGIDGARRAEDLEWSDWGKWLTELQKITFKFNHS